MLTSKSFRQFVEKGIFCFVKHTRILLALLVAGLGNFEFGQSANDEFAKSVATLRNVGGEGKGNIAASQAMEYLSNSGKETIPALLSAMDGANPFAANYLRGAIEVIFNKILEEGGSLPLIELGEFLLNKSHDTKPRAMAFDLIRRTDVEVANRLIPGLLGDPSVDLRREAISRLLIQASGLVKENKKPAAVLIYRQALDAARDLDQIQTIASELRELGRNVNLTQHFGFLTNWNLVGPFHNKGRAGFDEVFGPEKNFSLDAEYKGISGNVTWKKYATDDEYGMVDFNEPYGALKEVTGYARTTFISTSDRPAELRLGCKNAWKIWLNGKLVFGRDEYHRGMRIDQYKLPVQLNKGTNIILVKACQNEQKEEWTVQWQFQLRVCDSTGTAIHSISKTDAKVAAK